MRKRDLEQGNSGLTFRFDGEQTNSTSPAGTHYAVHTYSKIGENYVAETNFIETMQAFKSITYTATKSGPKLIVLGAVHGNEVCGTRGIERVMREMDAGSLTVTAGRVTFVPITNPKAYTLKQRAGDRNLNRHLAPTDTPNDFEDHIANWLCPLLAQHDVLLDLHSFQAVGQPFVLVGPVNNADALQPFTHALAEQALALRLGVHRAVYGWLDTYARGVQRRKDALIDPESRSDLDARYGVGTTEFMRSVGGYALTLECGQHSDPDGPQVAYRAIMNALAHLHLIEQPAPARVSPIEGLRIYEVVDKVHVHDTFSRSWSSFDVLRQGDIIGTRQSGEMIRAEEDGHILFPNALAAAGSEWFYLAKPDGRFASL
jgi:uncharacterized protein